MNCSTDYGQGVLLTVVEMVCVCVCVFMCVCMCVVLLTVVEMVWGGVGVVGVFGVFLFGNSKVYLLIYAFIDVLMY